MPKLIPIPDEADKPFWDAANEKRLIVQNCTSCSTLQYPPRPACRDCGSDKLEWKDTSGRGHILAYMVIEDGRLAKMMPDQPFNLVLVTLDEDPRINFYSNLPGHPAYKVPVGSPVEVIFEEVAPGTFVPEWKVVE